MKFTSLLKGLVFGVFLSVITAFIFMIFGQMAGGGVTSLTGESWLYFAVIIPFIITFTVLGGFFHNKNELSNKKLWLISLLSAFFITLYSGTIGAIFGEAIVRGGTETINIEGTLVWGSIYTFVLLPLTTPFARLLIEIFYKFIKKIK